MKHILKYVEWQGLSGDWYCNDTTDLNGIGSLWNTPAIMLGISAYDFVKLLLEKFKPTKVVYDKEWNVLVYSWKSQADMRKYKNWINAEARKRNFYVGA